MHTSITATAFVAGLLIAGATTSAEPAPIKVDRSNYQEAEVARNFTKWAKNGANNKLMHMTSVTPSGPAPTVRMNRDSLYSAAILDTSSGTASITLPEGDIAIGVAIDLRESPTTTLMAPVAVESRDEKPHRAQGPLNDPAPVAG